MSDSGDRREAVVEALKASQLREVLHHYGEALKARRKGIDNLNVYPVPDGDTGTNMSMTVQSVVAELKNAATDDMAAISQAISRGATMGARGNSGAILAQALRGVAESAKTKTALTPEDIAEALEKARKSAYEAVLKPVEGTILTVLTAAATAARKSADEGHKLKEQLDETRQAAADALARTPDLLPVLKQAGVVDAGGSGFLLFVDALRYVATGEPIPGITDAEAGHEDEPVAHDVDAGEIGELRYEVMFLLEGEADAAAFREAWGRVGDSIVVVGGDGLWNCHIHTDDIGASIEVALDYGRPRQIRITDLLEQAGGHEKSQRERVATAVVAVVSGHALAETYRSLGVQEIVSGGQSANPSVAELAKAIEDAPSDAVVVFPNNKNVRMAAAKAAEMSEKDVRVVDTISAVQGLGALFEYDNTQPIDTVFPALVAAAERISCGEVTRSVRNALTEIGPVNEGDWLGIANNEITVSGTQLGDVLVALAAKLVGEEAEIVALVEGDGATSEATAMLTEWMEANRLSTELQVQAGGQALYPYLLGVE